MNKIFWNTMLLIYLLEGDVDVATRLQYIYSRSLERKDQLFTSCLALGELMAGTKGDAGKQKYLREQLDALGFSYLPFDEGAVAPFSTLRYETRLKAPDAIHLACAASAEIDLFLTNDDQLFGLHVPGIRFVTDYKAPLF